MRKAVHKDTQALLALKTYEKKYLTNSQAANAVKCEIDNLAGLEHPNIMRLWEVVDQRTHVHLVMELCTGMPLYHVVKKLPDMRMNESKCRVIFRQIMLALDYMHS